MVQRVKIAFLGLGVVGSQLMDYIRSNQVDILEKYELQLDINKVFVRNLSKKRSIDTSQLILSDNPYEVMREADIVIECLGGNGVELTKELVLAAIHQKKAVIMSSKKCLALYGREIVNAMSESQTLFRYDATVGGGIPISSVMNTMGRCEKIHRIYGICNGTSNYILGEMQENKLNFEEALQLAKDKGYAENDPAEDVDGYDALYKTIILMGFGTNRWLPYQNLKPVSIRKITEEDFTNADRNESVIKSVFYVAEEEGEILCYVGPTKVKKDSLLASVKGCNNIIVIDGNESGERAFYGKGAGAKPTASAMYDDLISILEAGYRVNKKIEYHYFKEVEQIRSWQGVI